MWAETFTFIHTCTCICVHSSQTVLEHHRSFISSTLVSQLEEKKKKTGQPQGFEPMVSCFVLWPLSYAPPHVTCTCMLLFMYWLASRGGSQLPSVGTNASSPTLKKKIDVCEVGDTCVSYCLSLWCKLSVNHEACILLHVCIHPSRISLCPVKKRLMVSTWVQMMDHYMFQHPKKSWERMYVF